LEIFAALFAVVSLGFIGYFCVQYVINCGRQFVNVPARIIMAALGLVMIASGFLAIRGPNVAFLDFWLAPVGAAIIFFAVVLLKPRDPASGNIPLPGFRAIEGNMFIEGDFERCMEGRFNDFTTRVFTAVSDTRNPDTGIRTVYRVMVCEADVPSAGDIAMEITIGIAIDTLLPHLPITRDHYRFYGKPQEAVILLVEQAPALNELLTTDLHFVKLKKGVLSHKITIQEYPDDSFICEQLGRLTAVAKQMTRTNPDCAAGSCQ